MTDNSTEAAPDWQITCARIKTILPGDLFQLVEKSIHISHYVRDGMSLYPEQISKALLWHQHNSDNEIERRLNKEFEAYCDIAGSDEAEIMAHLRLFRRFHSTAIAINEVTNHLPIESTSARISALADCLIERAYWWSHLHCQKRFGTAADTDGRELAMLILAMGKLGGKELNFSSDIDLIFFYPEDGLTLGAGRQIENSRFFRRLSTLLIKLLDEVTSDGFVFRVDMRLRPYGDSGALVTSIAQAEEYYHEQGREWERFAMLRCRLVTGADEDKAHLMSVLQPFSFRRYIDFGVIDSIRSMKAMIQREVMRKGLVDNIKLGAGGIREVEFIVQSLQLIQGGRDRRLRESNIFTVLPRLVEAKLLPEETERDLFNAYRFLRRLEHCIQAFAEKQTQQLPTSDEERTALCKALNFADWSALLYQLQAHQELVNQHFKSLLGEERRQGHSQDDFFQSLAEGHLEPKEVCKITQQKYSRELDLHDSIAFIEQIDSFINEPAVRALSPRGADRLNTFFPALLATCLNTDFPVLTLQRLLKVLRAIMRRTAYLELLSENPPVLQHLVDLAGHSEWMVERLSTYPVLFDELLYPNSLYEPLQSADLKAELQQSLLRINEGDEEELLDSVRVFKQTNELRIAAALLSQRLSISQVSRYLTALAEVVLQVSVEQCWRILAARHGIPASLTNEPGETGFAVIGYGKLGGRELGFGSDLDLVFLFNQPVDERTNGNRSLNTSRFYTRLAQKILHFLSVRTNLGLLYDVDMRLRPSGASGLLVSHMDAYRDYQMESAWTWEHQALVRARFVAGDKRLQNRFGEVRQMALTKVRDCDQLKADVVQMRSKMREQLQSKSHELIDLKQISGGLVDIEFLAQYFCLSVKNKEPIPNNTVECLIFAKDHKLLSSHDAQILIKNYREFRNELNQIAILEKNLLNDNETIQAPLAQNEKIWKKVFAIKT